MVFLRIFLVSVISIGLFNNTAAQKQKGKNEQVKVDVDKDLMQQAEYLFAEGMKHFLLEDYKKSIVLFKESLEILPENPSASYKIAHSHFYLENYDKALAAVEQAVRIDNGNEYFHVLKADIYEKQKNYRAVAETYEQILANFTPNERYFFNLASAYLRQNESEKAIQTYNRAEEIMGISESLVQFKQRILLNMNDLEGALQEGEKLISSFPSNSRYKLAQATLLLQLQKRKEALTFIQKVIDDEPLNPQAQAMLARVYLGDGEIAVADSLIELAFQSNEMEPSEKIKLIRFYLNQSTETERQRVEKVAGFTKTALEIQPDSPQLNALYAELLSLNKDFDQALARYKQSLKENPDNYELWLKVIDIEWKTGKYDQVTQTAAQAQEFFPNQAELYLFQGSAHYLMKEYEMALEVLEIGKIYALDPKLKQQFNSQLGDVYFYLGDYAQSDAAYNEVLAVDPNNINVLNNYAYFLALRKENLDKAMEMGKKLLELAPDQPNYLDTYGWVLFQANKLKEARKYLEKAADQNPKSGTILEHYGDVLYKLGEKEAALEQWNKAQNAGGVDDPEKLAEKIQEGKLIE